MIPVKRTDIRLKAAPRKVILKFLDFANPSRFQPVVDAVLGMGEAAAELQLSGILAEFEHRHFDLPAAFLENYERLAHYAAVSDISSTKKMLIGAYFTHEYSFQAAALFNPSIVLHPDQTGIAPGQTRFILSLRATGEGHISSISFLTGILGENGEVMLEASSQRLTTGKHLTDLHFDKHFLLDRLLLNEEYKALLASLLPESFNEKQVLELVADQPSLREQILKIFDENYDLRFSTSSPIDSRVLFPASGSESNGMEDARFVLFEEGDTKTYFGTYTAYNGKVICPQLIETQDFQFFKIRPLHGAAASDKGMALFPRKINGQYAMIGRQGGRSLSIMFSNDLYCWNEYQPLQHPQRDWELLQMGNCGSPIETPKGWLLLTHAVGAMRKYVLSLTLLDLENPERVISSLEHPLLSPNEEEREGYVPNVLYTCGMMLHNGQLVIPYAMSDNAISFATVELVDVLFEMMNDK
jgi:predicted GH43/DUF377 family glycosyl hydrolase